MSTNYTLRQRIDAKALELDCAKDVAPLSDRRAIRYLQEREGHTGCYGRREALIPGGNIRTCGVDACSWKKECDAERKEIYNIDRDVRADILRRADELGCLRNVISSSNVVAIRVIQEWEGNTTCFGRSEPLRPSPFGDRRCGETACYWLQLCDAYRNEAIVPLDSAFAESNYDDIADVESLLLQGLETDSLPDHDGVGLQIRGFAKAASATRKLVLASPKTVIAENFADGGGRAFLVKHRAEPSASSGSAWISYTYDVLFTRDAVGLQEWLRTTAPVRETGAVAFKPALRRISDTVMYSRSDIIGDAITKRRLSLDLPNQPPEPPFNAPHVAVPDGELFLTRSELVPLLNLELPVLQNIDFGTLARVCDDYPEELTLFRDYLQAQLETARCAAIESERFDADCRRIERELREGLRAFRSDLQKAQIKSSLAATGTAVASWTLAVYCILRGEGDVLKTIGPGGALCTIAATYAQYLVSQIDLKRHPVYFLWMLGHTSA